MASKMIERMVALVQEGRDARAVLESTLSLHPGSSAKVNKATTGTDPVSGAAVAVPEGTVVTILGVGGGYSGVDHHVKLPDGRQAVIPFYDLGESVQRIAGESARGRTLEQITDVVTKVTLTKPLPQSAIDWVGGGYSDYGVKLPSVPETDSATAVTFMMKAEDQEMLDAAVEALKKASGSSFKSVAAATLKDWENLYK